MSAKELNQEKVDKIEENLQEKMNEALNQFDKIKDILPNLEKYLDVFDQKITPIFELAKKTKDLIEKFIFSASIFNQIKHIIPFLQKITEKNDNSINMST